jgi:serine/threonine-protein kinase
VAAALILAPVMMFAQAGAGWSGFGPETNWYQVFLDTTVARSGRVSFALSSLPAAQDSTWFAGQQIVDAKQFRGRRVRITANVKSDSVGMATLWLVVDGRVGATMSTLAHDSTSVRQPVRGTRAWQKVEMVVDIDPRAICIRFGPTIRGRGTAWFDAFTFTIVDKTVPPTAKLMTPEPLKGKSGGPESQACTPMVAAPTNLDFEQ